jgi:hypothetical protein
MLNNRKSLFLKIKIKRQRGQAFLVLMITIALGTAAVIYSLFSSNKATIEAEKKNAAIFIQAKEALIGYAATHSTRPGALPCPDTNNDGNGETANAAPGGNSCPSYIGRLPWKNLGLPDLRDSYGERLWYLLSPNFRNANPPSGPVLNSDTAGQITITGNTNPIIAAIIAPGTVIGAQDRDPLDPAKSNNANNFLEGGNQNSGATLTLTTGANINDQLMLITHENFFPKVEARVAREIKKLLQDYYDLSSNTPPGYRNYYPFAAPLTGTACVAGTYRGRVPTTACPPLNTLTLPPWFGPTGSGNRWNEVIIYAVAPRCTPKIVSTPDFTASPLFFLTPVLETLGLHCQSITIFGIPLLRCYPYTQTIDTTTLNCQNNDAGPFLTMDGAPTEALLFSAGRGLAGQLPRPCANAAACLEDQENTDGPSNYPSNTSVDGADNFIYTKPQKTDTNNDNLVIVRPDP